MDKKAMQELIDDSRAKREPGGVIVAVDETHYQINEHPYELLKNYRDAFDRTELADRFNTYFSRYDYLVGDWGFGQLRLRGFYDDKRNVAGEFKISALQDYLNEVCNTGCPYFVMHNEEAKMVTPKRSSRQRDNNHRGRHQDGGRKNARQRQHDSGKKTNGSKQNQQSVNRGQRPDVHPGGASQQKQAGQHQPQAQNNHGGRSQNRRRNQHQNRNHAQSPNEQTNHQRRSQENQRRHRSTNGQQKAYTVEKIKPVNPTPVAKRQGTVKTVGHSQHRKFTIREKED